MSNKPHDESALAIDLNESAEEIEKRGLDQIAKVLGEPASQKISRFINIKRKSVKEYLTLNFGEPLSKEDQALLRDNFQKAFESRHPKRHDEKQFIIEGQPLKDI